MARAVKGSSDKAFGVTFAVVFALFGLWPWLVRGQPPHVWALGLALLFGTAAFLLPRLLSPLNRLWFRFGMALHHIVNPIVMTLLYYGAFVPVGLVAKLTGKDPLRLKCNRQGASYWIRREPPGPAPQSMAKQF